MTWFVWRLHRIEVYIGAALLAAFAVLILITGEQMASQYHSALLACTASDSCANLSSTVFLGSHAVGFLVIMTLGVPALFGLFWGAPLVAREFETGTMQFAWMQSVTRKRWFATEAGWVLLASAAWGGAISALVTWWSGPNNALQLDRFDNGRFDLQGLVPVGYALFAAALGIAAGTLIRRTLPAIAVTLGGVIAVRFVIAELLRPHYMTALTVTYKLTGKVPALGSAWQITQGIIAPDGKVVPPVNGIAVANIPISFLPGSCMPQGRGAAPLSPSCVSAIARFRGFITYQPASRFWAFQGIETGIFVGLAAALIALAAVVLLRRDA
jgi:hypothetical protein